MQPLPQQLSGPRHVVRLDQDRRRTGLLQHRPGDVAEPGGSQRVRTEPADLDVHRTTGGERCVPRGATLRLDADHPRLAGERRRDPTGETTAADGDQHRVDPARLLGAVHLLGELQTDRSLAGDHGRLVVGVHGERAGLVLVLDGGREGLGVALADEMDVGTPRPQAGHLARGSRGGDEDRCPDVELRRRPRDGEAVVAPAGRHHAGLGQTVRLRRRQQGGEGTSRLEGARVLQVLQLQGHRNGAEHARLDVQHRGPSDPASDPIGRSHDVVPGEGCGLLGDGHATILPCPRPDV